LDSRLPAQATGCGSDNLWLGRIVAAMRLH
jgi:hypothetical protein